MTPSERLFAVLAHAPVVFLALVASRSAASAAIGLLVVDAHGPVAERNIFSYILWRISSMGIMTGPAGSPFFLIHMPIVKVGIGVPEVGSILGIRLQGQGFVMASKAEFVFARVECGIKGAWIRTHQ